MQVDAYTGEIRIFSFDAIPDGWALCNGQTLNIQDNLPLFSLLGTKYGGDGRTNFALPDLRGKIAAGTGGYEPLAAAAPAASDDAFFKQHQITIAKEQQGWVALAFCIALDGLFPSSD